MTRMFEQMGAARAPLAAFAAMGLAWGAYAALIPDTKAMLRAGDAAFGSLLLATPLAAVAAMLLAPRVAPAFGPRVLPLSLMALALAFALPGWQHQPAAFALAMVLVGLTNGFLDVVMTARVGAIEAARAEGLMNLTHAAYSFGYAASAMLTGGARSLGASPGMVMTTAALAILALSLIAVERGADTNSFAQGARGRARLGPVPLWGGLIVLIAFMSENAAENWSALHIERTLGGSPAAGSFGPAVLALTMGFGRIFGQALVARLAERQVLGSGAVVAAAGMALAGLAPSPSLAYLGLVVVGLGGSVLAPTAFTLIGRLGPPDLRARRMARATALGYLGYFFGPPALGFIAELAGLRLSFLAMALAILAVNLLVPPLMRAGTAARGAAETR